MLRRCHKLLQSFGEQARGNFSKPTENLVAGPRPKVNCQKKNPKYVENHRGKVKKFPDTCMKISKVLINFYKALVSKLMEIFEADRTLRGRVMAESKLSECG